MFDNYNYPAGADNEMAPWNEPIVPDMDFDVTCSQSLSKTAEVITNDYLPGSTEVDYEREPDGSYSSTTYAGVPDTSDTDWEEAYHDNDHYTPLQLIELFKRFLDDKITGKNTVPNSTSYLKRIKAECEGWFEDYVDYSIWWI
jgi:hypothetical protein